MYIIETFYVITYSGLLIYTQNAHLGVEASLFAGFISAINSFVNEMGETNINKINMGMSQIIIMKSEEHNVFFVGIANSKVKDKKVEKYLRKLKEKFCKYFGDDMKKFTGNLQPFMNAGKVLNFKEDPDNSMGKMVTVKRRNSFFNSL